MSATITWKGGDDGVTVAAGELVGFYGPSEHNDPIPVGDYQSSTRRRTAAGADGGAMPNCKYVTSGTVDIGAGAEAVSGVPSSACSLHIEMVASTSVACTDTYFDAYGSTTSEAPGAGDVTVKAFEAADVAWSDVGPPATARLQLDNQGAAVTHDYYVGVSVSPQDTGEFTFTMRFSTNYT